MTTKKKPAKKMAKPVKAWAFVSAEGKITDLLIGAKPMHYSWPGERIARVEIKEIK